MYLQLIYLLIENQRHVMMKEFNEEIVEFVNSFNDMLKNGTDNMHLLFLWIEAEHESDEYLRCVSFYGLVSILEWRKNNSKRLDKPLFTSHIMDYASIGGRVECLEWVKNSGLEIYYSLYAIGRASSSGHIEVLEWWKNSGLRLKYDIRAMDYASASSRIDVLEWWKNSGLELKYSPYSTYIPSLNMDIKVLEWWKNSGLEVLFNTGDADIMYFHVSIIEWWIDFKPSLMREFILKSKLSVGKKKKTAIIKKFTEDKEIWTKLWFL